MECRKHPCSKGKCDQNKCPCDQEPEFIADCTARVQGRLVRIKPFMFGKGTLSIGGRKFKPPASPRPEPPKGQGV